MKIIIQKFGGSSLATGLLRETAVKHIRRALESGYQPVVVVSAIGRLGDPYATDTLKHLLEEIHPRPPLRELDVAMCCGEIISAAVMAVTLHRENIMARSFTGEQAGLVTDGCYGSAQVVHCQPEQVKRCLESGGVAVVAGFQGSDREGQINTLGRGGSDTTAVILGAALKAERVEIYTDVNGISTADPRLLEEARVIPRLTYNEVCELAYDGARVIHPAAVEMAMIHNLQVVVRSLIDEQPGTLISARPAMPESGFSVQAHREVAGVAHSSGITQVVVDFPRPDPELETALFTKLGRAGISIDLISVFPEIKIFTVKDETLNRVEEVLADLGVSYRVAGGCAKVSVVGLGMRGIPGVMARMVQALKEENITILQTADSNISISVLIRGEDLVPAVRALHEHFGLNEDGDLDSPNSCKVLPGGLLTG